MGPSACSLLLLLLTSSSHGICALAWSNLPRTWTLSPALLVSAHSRLTQDGLSSTIDINLELQTAPHPDIPDDSKIFAQIVINRHIFLHTIPIGISESGNRWKIAVHCNIPRNVSPFSIHVFRQSGTNVTRVLGKASCSVEEGRDAGPFEITHPLNKVNDDGPVLVLSATFSFGPPVTFSRAPKGDFQIPNSKSNFVDTNLPALATRVLTLHEDARTGKSIDLLETQLIHASILLCPSHEPIKAKLLHVLGNTCSKFHQSKAVGDLRRAACAYGDAVREGAGRLDPSFWDDFGICLQNCFGQLGQVTYLNRAVEAHQTSLSFTSDDNPNKASRLTNLGACLIRRFEHSGDIADLNQGFKVQQDAVLLTPDNHSDKLSQLNNLGVTLRLRYDRLGDLADLNRAVKLQEKVVSRAQDGNPDKTAQLTNLGSSLMRRFDRLGKLEDVQRAVQLLQHAVTLSPDGHPDKPSQLNNLASSLMRRFHSTGDLTDLNRAIQLQQDAISHTPDGHPQKPYWLTNLGNFLMRRYERIGDFPSLDQAIQILQFAVSLTPDSLPDKPSRLNSLGISLRRRFERLGGVADLNRGVQVQQEAVSLAPTGHADKPYWHNSFGNSLLRRFDHLGDVADLNRAIQHMQIAVDLTPVGHLDKPSRLSNLGGSLHSRFDRLGDIADLDRAIELLQDAVSLAPDGHPDKPTWLNNLANFLYTRFKTTLHEDGVFPRRDDDFHAAIQTFSNAANSTAGSPEYLFMAARRWLELSIDYLPSQAMKAAKVSIQTIPQLAWMGSQLPDRHHRVIQAGSTARDAAAIAMMNGELELAVEWLEQGLSVVWSQVLELRRRSQIDELGSTHPELASKLWLLSSQLEGSTSLVLAGDTTNQHPPAFDYHQAAHERDILLVEIRKQPGFEGFLLPRTLNQLLPAANNGPVVLLLASRISCDALIIRPGSFDVLHVPLKEKFPLERAQALRELLQQARTKTVLSVKDVPSLLKVIFQPQDSSLVNVDREVVMSVILEDLWERVVYPVLDALSIKTPMESRSKTARRIWWCPTGPFAFLPIHAAGVYDEENGPRLPDYVVSSYTPTLATLLRDRKPNTAPAPTQRRLLTIALPNESGLPGTRREVKAIAKHAQAAGMAVLPLTETEATPNRVSKEMKQSTWSHFACHGKQNPSNPTESCLLLSGGSKLTLSDIIKLSFNAELAFLSACETATGDKSLEDEAVHLAAGMLLAGYRGVIATMWRIDDSFAVDVADKTYQVLFGEYGGDGRRAAEALHFAIKRVCEEKGQRVPLFHWVPFMHLGI